MKLFINNHVEVIFRAVSFGIGISNVDTDGNVIESSVDCPENTVSQLFNTCSVGLCQCDYLSMLFPPLQVPRDFVTSCSDMGSTL